MSIRKHFGNPWPVGIIGFFVVFISATVAWVVFASRQQMDLVRPDYYEEELRYQQHIDAVNLTAAVQHEVAIEYLPATQTITLKLPPAQAQAGLTGRVEFYRPSNAALDHQLPLAPEADGSQTIDVKTLQAGRWQVRLFWTADGRDYYFGQRIELAPRDG